MNEPKITIVVMKYCPTCLAVLEQETNPATGESRLVCSSQQFPPCGYSEPLQEARRAKIETCRSCGAQVWWGKTKNDKAAPFNVVNGEPTDENHFITCPQRRDWRKS